MVKSLLIAVNESYRATMPANSCYDLPSVADAFFTVYTSYWVAWVHQRHAGGKRLTGFIAYGVLIGEVVAPVLIIVGLFTRPAALVLAFTMIVAWLMVGTGETFALDAVGAWAIESLVYFFIGALAVACLGAGRFALGKAPVWR